MEANFLCGDFFCFALFCFVLNERRRTLSNLNFKMNTLVSVLRINFRRPVQGDLPCMEYTHLLSTWHHPTYLLALLFLEVLSPPPAAQLFFLL